MLKEEGPSSPPPLPTLIVFLTGPNDVPAVIMYPIVLSFVNWINFIIIMNEKFITVEILIKIGDQKSNYIIYISWNSNKQYLLTKYAYVSPMLPRNKTLIQSSKNIFRKYIIMVCNSSCVLSRDLYIFFHNYCICVIL